MSLCCGVNSSSFSHLLSLDLFGTELVAHTVNCITPQLAAPAAWKWGGLLTCSWHWGQWPGLCPETNRTLKKINKHTLIYVYIFEMDENSRVSVWRGLLYLYGLAQALQCWGLHRCYDTSDWSTFIYWFDSFDTWTLIWGQEQSIKVKVKMYLYNYVLMYHGPLHI